LRYQHGALNGSLKMLISRGTGQRGYGFPDHDADFYMFYYPSQTRSFAEEYIDSGVLKAQMGLKTPQLVGLKSLNCLEQVLFKYEAQQQQWPEALVTDLKQHVVEGVSSNCFFYLDGVWVSPILSDNGVHGVMRAEILQRMQQHQLHYQLRHVDVAEIAQIESLFFCNALAPMKIVQKFQQRNLAIQPCVELLNILKLNQLDSYA
jgi:4-amino-4-deoxychorismate lyase